MSVNLDPPPAVLADLLVRATRLDWPTAEAERREFFTTLGWRDTESHARRVDADGPLDYGDDHDPDSSFHGFETSLPGVDGSGSTLRDEYLGFSMFCYVERGEHQPAARAGFVALREQLSLALGAPVEEWGPIREPACLWETGILSVEMYCFQRGSSSVMVGISHTERSAANDAASFPKGRDLQ